MEPKSPEEMDAFISDSDMMAIGRYIQKPRTLHSSKITIVKMFPIH
jgi:hypothetical protein